MWSLPSWEVARRHPAHQCSSPAQGVRRQRRRSQRQEQGQVLSSPLELDPQGLRLTAACPWTWFRSLMTGLRCWAVRAFWTTPCSTPPRPPPWSTCARCWGCRTPLPRLRRAGRQVQVGLQLGQALVLPAMMLERRGPPRWSLRTTTPCTAALRLACRPLCRLRWHSLPALSQGLQQQQQGKQQHLSRRCLQWHHRQAVWQARSARLSA
mmetsp:Transcript_22304/g.48742  ORF Transcript_22304/g.48742 Transcript_22304/m.48742 type:complete len:209 (-) Transcript_22304:1602-2228(-)